MVGYNVKKGGTMITRMVCSICFIALSFLWLYWFQADMLTVAQHALSGGVTHYDRTIGAVLITLVLCLLQLAVYALTRLSRFTHALTYGPSFLGLAYLSDITFGPGNSVVVGRLWWLLALLFVLWAAAVWLSRQLMPFGRDDSHDVGLFSSRTWVNLLQMAAMMLVVAAIGNTNAVDHFKAHAETALMRGDDDEALRVGEESLETDAHLTMLRAYALSRCGLMGEKLFCYPIAGKGEDLLPIRNKPLILPADTIWKRLGAKPAFPMKAQRFYHCMLKDSLATEAVADYVLCSLLIDRNLDAFVKQLPKFYGTSAQLPRHYREALVLYAHQHPEKTVAGNGTPAFVINDGAMEQEWQQMLRDVSRLAQGTESRLAQGAVPVRATLNWAGSEQQLQMLEKYRDTYWYYYYSHNRMAP